MESTPAVCDGVMLSVVALNAAGRGRCDSESRPAARPARKRVGLGVAEPELKKPALAQLYHTIRRGPFDGDGVRGDLAR